MELRLSRHGICHILAAMVKRRFSLRWFVLGMSATFVGLCISAGLVNCVQHPTQGIDDVVPDDAHPWNQPVVVSGAYADRETTIVIQVATDDEATHFAELARTTAQGDSVNSPPFPPYYVWQINQTIPMEFWHPGRSGGYRAILRAAALIGGAPLLLGSPEKPVGEAACRLYESYDGSIDAVDASLVDDIRRICGEPMDPRDSLFVYRTPSYAEVVDGAADSSASPRSGSSGCGCNLGGHQ